jgi:hypothetical protein
VPWEFLRFNLLSGQSALYGSHPWHWNLSQGFPAVAATLLPLMAGGLVLSRDTRLAALAALSLAIYSLPAHKEFRFLLPALQLAMPYCGPALDWLLNKGQGSPAASGAGSKVRAGEARERDGGEAVAAAGVAAEVDARNKRGSSGSRRGWPAGQRLAAMAAVGLLAGVQILMALYFSLVQHRWAGLG